MRIFREDVEIDGQLYTDTYGEDIGKGDNTVNVGGVPKKLYSGNYIKLQKHVPIQEIDFKNDEPLNFIAYKQFNTLYNPNDKKTWKYKGMLFPLYISKNSEGIKLHKWYKCGQGELKIKVDNEGKPIEGSPMKVGSKLGNLSFRPGWHIASKPLTRHIGKVNTSYIDKNGNRVVNENDYEYQNSQTVWAEVEYSAHYDYTDKARSMKGACTDPRKACFVNREDFSDGYYRYKTNANADDDMTWIIADAIKVNRVLTDKQVRDIVGDKAQKRYIADGSSFCSFMADFSQFEE